MLKIGLTGGIGSGKTTIARIFEVLGIPVYYADAEAKRLMNTDPGLRKQIIAAFGPESYKEGILDRAWVAKQVFDNSEKLNLLNSYVHPLTIRDAESWMNRQNAPYAIKEAALIFEGGLEKYFDFIIGVSAPESLRLERTLQRDNTTTEQVLLRMRQQMNEDEKMSRCDFVILNDGIHAVIPQVLKIDETLNSKMRR
jgi:dephospho-CoA kinase